MDSIQIWHVVVTSLQGVPNFKVTLNSHIQRNYFEIQFFIFLECTENNFIDFIQALHVYVTVHSNRTFIKDYLNPN